MKLAEAINHPAFSHARQGVGCWRDVVWIYLLDPASPSGVSLANVEEQYTAAEADALLRARRTSALSPAERAP